MAIPTLKEWKEGTDVPLAFRSTGLKAIDKALEAYWKKDETPQTIKLRRLTVVFHDWHNSKKAAGGTERNFAGMVTRMARELAGKEKSDWTPEERAALQALDDSRRDAFRKMFERRRVIWKNGSARTEAQLAAITCVKAAQQISKANGVDLRRAVPSGARGAVSAARGAIPSIHGGGGGGGGTFSFVKDFEGLIGKFFGVVTGEVRSIVQSVIGSSFGEFVTDALPVIGLIKDIGGTVAGWGKVLWAAHKESLMEGRGHVLAKGGSAQAAFTALRTILDRETSQAIVSASITSTSLAGKVGGAMLDGGVVSGPATAAAKGLATLTQKLYVLGREYRETKLANALLADPSKLDLSLFEVYPLLGAYMLCCSTLSDVVNLTSMSFGASAWMDDVEFAKRAHIDPIRTKCAALIGASPFVIEGLTPYASIGKWDQLLQSRKTKIARALA